MTFPRARQCCLLAAITCLLMASGRLTQAQSIVQSGYDLYVIGTNSADRLEIAISEPTGRNNVVLTLNDDIYVFDFVESLRIDLGHGDNVVTFHNTFVPSNLHLALGDGNDTIEFDWYCESIFVGGHFVIEMGEGRNSCIYNRFASTSHSIHVDGSLHVSGGQGPDMFAWYTALEVLGDCRVNLRDGNNSFAAIGFPQFTGGTPGPHIVIHGRTTIDPGRNKDWLHFQSASLRYDVTIDLGNGNNECYLLNCHLPVGAMLTGGLHSDALEFRDCTGSQPVSIKSGTGSDSVLLVDMGRFDPGIDIDTGAGDDTITVWYEVGSPLRIETGTGLDELELHEAEFDESIYFNSSEQVIMNIDSCNFQRRADFELGNLSNHITLTETRFEAPFSIFSGDGWDDFSIDRCEIYSEFLIQLGAGGDWCDIEDSIFEPAGSHVATIDGGDDYDELHLLGTNQFNPRPAFIDFDN